MLLQWSKNLEGLSVIVDLTMTEVRLTKIETKGYWDKFLQKAELFLTNLLISSKVKQKHWINYLGQEIWEPWERKVEKKTLKTSLQNKVSPGILVASTH